MQPSPPLPRDAGCCMAVVSVSKKNRQRRRGLRRWRKDAGGAGRRLSTPRASRIIAAFAPLRCGHVARGFRSCDARGLQPFRIAMAPGVLKVGVLGGGAVVVGRPQNSPRNASPEAGPPSSLTTPPSVGGSSGRRRRLERDRPLRAGDDAEAARLAPGRVRRVGRLPAVDEHLELAEQRQGLEVGVLDARDLEDLVRATSTQSPFASHRFRFTTGRNAPGSARHCSPGRSGCAAARRAFSRFNDSAIRLPSSLKRIVRGSSSRTGPAGARTGQHARSCSGRRQHTRRAGKGHGARAGNDMARGRTGAWRVGGQGTWARGPIEAAPGDRRGQRGVYRGGARGALLRPARARVGVRARGMRAAARQKVTTAASGTPSARAKNRREICCAFPATV